MFVVFCYSKDTVNYSSSILNINYDSIVRCDHLEEEKFEDGSTLSIHMMYGMVGVDLRANVGDKAFVLFILFSRSFPPHVDLKA